MKPPETTITPLRLLPDGDGYVLADEASTVDPADRADSGPILAAIRRLGRERAAVVNLHGRMYNAIVHQTDPAAEDQGAYVFVDESGLPAELVGTVEATETGSSEDELDLLFERTSASEGIGELGRLPLSSCFVEPTFTASTKGVDSQLKWSSLRGYRRLVITGPPGAGKTSTLRRMAHELATSEGSAYSPYYIQLRSVDSNRGGMTLDPWADQEMMARAETGRLILLLDGLDEVTSWRRESLIRSLSDFAMSHPLVRIVVASRPGVGAETLPSFTHLSIQAFSRDQVAQWLFLNTDARVATSIQQVLAQDNGLAEVARTPLLLVLCTEQYRQRGDMSTSRAELVQRWLDALLHTWDSARGVRRDFSPIGSTPTLRALAQCSWHMRESGQHSFSPHDFVKWTSVGDEPLGLAWLEWISHTSGLLRPVGPDQWMFSHALITDYLAAENLVSQLGDVTSRLAFRLEDPTWHEVFALSCEMASDASPLISTALNESELSVNVATALLSAIQRPLKVSDAVRRRVMAVTTDFLRSLAAAPTDSDVPSWRLAQAFDLLARSRSAQDRSEDHEADH